MRDSESMRGSEMQAPSPAVPCTRRDNRGTWHMLTRLHVRGYKSLRDVQVRLPALALLMGPNAAGKSNFLDCLQLLSKLTTARTLKEAFDPPYRGNPLESFTFGPGGVRGSLASETLTFSIEADIRLSRQVIEAVNRQIRDMRRTTPDEPEAGEERFVICEKINSEREVRGILKGAGRI